MPTDPSAFEEFYDLYCGRVLTYFTRRLFNAETAVELTAETFAVALDRCEQFRGTTAEEEQGWLFAIARSELSHLWRRGQVERKALRRMGLEPPTLDDDELERVERMAGLEGLKDRLGQALGGLPASQREAIEMRVLRDMDYPDIATDLAVTEDVVRARVSRGLRALSAALHDTTVDWGELA